MSAHDPEHQELIDLVLAGQRDPAEPEVRERLAACAECRAELASLRAFDAELGAHMVGTRADLARAAAEANADEEERVRRTLTEALADRRRHPRPLLLWLVAATVVLAGSAGLWLALRPTAPVEEIYLHGGSLLCTRPVCSVEDYDAFQWSGELPPLGRFELRIYSRAGGSLLKTILCPEAQWVPTAE